MYVCMYECTLGHTLSAPSKITFNISKYKTLFGVTGWGNRDRCSPSKRKRWFRNIYYTQCFLFSQQNLSALFFHLPSLRVVYFITCLTSHVLAGVVTTPPPAHTHQVSSFNEGVCLYKTYVLHTSVCSTVIKQCLWCLGYCDEVFSEWCFYLLDCHIVCR